MRADRWLRCATCSRPPFRIHHPSRNPRCASSTPTSSTRPTRNTKAPYNQLFNIPRVYTPEDKAIQRANSGTPYSCVGEGEEAIVEIADAIDTGEDWTTVRNLCVKRGDEVVKNPSRQLVDLEDIAIPDFDESRLVYITEGKVRRNLYPPNFGASTTS